MRKLTQNITLLGIALFFLVSPCMSQTYFTTLGLRFGNSNERGLGLTFQQRVLKKLTIEGIIQTDFKYNTTFHALAEGHYNLISRRLNLYYGAGPSWGWEESTFKDKETNQVVTTYGNKTVGVDLIGGLEVTLARMNISVDYKPNFNLAGREPWITSEIGISARYVLVKNTTVVKAKRKRQRAKKKKARVKARENGEKRINWPWQK